MDANRDDSGPTANANALARLLEGMPVTERRLDLAGVSTSLLEGGKARLSCSCTGRSGVSALHAASSRPSCGSAPARVRRAATGSCVRCSPIPNAHVLCGVTAGPRWRQTTSSKRA